MQNKELAATLKKQRGQLKQLEAATQAAKQQHQTELEELQQQLRQAKSLPSNGPVEEDHSRADLTSLHTQLQEAHNQIKALEQRPTPSNASGTIDTNAVPSSVTSTPTKPSQAVDAPTPVPAVPVDKEQGISSAEAQLAEAQKRLGKAKRYMTNLKQQLADMTSAKEQAEAQLLAVQQQQQQQSEQNSEDKLAEGDTEQRSGTAGQEADPRAQCEDLQVKLQHACWLSSCELVQREPLSCMYSGPAKLLAASACISARVTFKGYRTARCMLCWRLQASAFTCLSLNWTLTCRLA